MKALFALAFLLCISLGSADDCYMFPVGISDPSTIPDNQLTASTQYNSFYQAAYGRLNGDRGDGWCAKRSSRTDDWLQVDFGTKVQVCGVATQGDVSGNEWVTDFKLSFSFDGNTWTTYRNGNGAEVEFHRAGDNKTSDQHRLPVKVTARFIRFWPTKQQRWNCLRVEAYGTVVGLNCYKCSSKKSMSDCDNSRKLVTCSSHPASCFKETLNYKVGNFKFRLFQKGCAASKHCYSATSYQLCKAADDRDCELDCCEGDHCNTSTAPSVSVLLVVACALVFFFC